jgi:hypothetical protein
MEEIGVALEKKRQANWESTISLDTMYNVITSMKKFSPITGILALLS